MASEVRRGMSTVSAAAGKLKEILRRVSRLCRYSKILAFFVSFTGEARQLRRDPQHVADEAHLRGAWNFATPVEREWQRHALSVVTRELGTGSWGDSLEIGCSEGVFTAELGKRCLSVTAFDISPMAVARAAQRCGAYANIRVGRLDAATEDIPGQYDLVFVMDVLWLVAGRRRKHDIAPKLARALRDGGLLVFSDSRMPKWVRHSFWSLLLPTGADQWAKVLGRTPGLTVVHRECYRPDRKNHPEFWEKLFVLFRKQPANGM